MCNQDSPDNLLPARGFVTRVYTGFIGGYAYYDGSVPEGMYVHSVPDSVPAVPGYVLPVCGRRLRMGEWYYTTVVPGYLPLPPMQKLHFREFTWSLCRAR